MRSILVVARRHLFPGLSPQGFLAPDAVDLDAVGQHLFFAEREYMEIGRASCRERVYCEV